MNFHDVSCPSHSSGSPFLFAFVESTFDSFSFLTRTEKHRFLKHLNFHLAHVVSDKNFYKTAKLTKYERQGDLQQKFYDNTYDYSPGMIYVLANYFDVNICITNNRHGSFTYTIYAPVHKFEQKSAIVFTEEKQGKYVGLYNSKTPNEYVLNPLSYIDINKFFTLYNNRKTNELLPYYKYKIQDLQKLAKNFNMDVFKEGRGAKKVKKTKKELYTELNDILS